jgi:hypothetical protein
VIVFAREGAAGLQRVAATGGAPTAVTTPAAGVRHVHPFFLADGRDFLLAAVRGATNTSSDVYRGRVGKRR